MVNKRYLFYKGFITYFVLSSVFNFSFMIILNRQAEYLASDLLHLIPTGIFNEMIEVITPMFPDMYFLLPIGITDGIIGGFIGLLIYRFVSNHSYKILYILIISFAIFEFVDVKFIPVFTS